MNRKIGKGWGQMRLLFGASGVLCTILAAVNIAFIYRNYKRDRREILQRCADVSPEFEQRMLSKMTSFERWIIGRSGK